MERTDKNSSLREVHCKRKETGVRGGVNKEVFTKMGKITARFHDRSNLRDKIDIVEE